MLKIRPLALVFVCALSLCVVAGLQLAVAGEEHDHSKHAQGEHAEGQPPMGAPAEMKKVAFLQGDWDVAVKMRMSAEQPWMESNASASVKPMLNGCAQVMEFSGTMMGMPFEGRSTSCYNREKGIWQNTWMDNMSASMTYAEGNWEGDKLVMIAHSQMMGQEYMSKDITQKVSEDEVHWAMDMSMDDGATWFTTMEMTFTRRKV